jgi:uncharacterized protein YndB with AHSA1/START domain
MMTSIRLWVLKVIAAISMLLVFSPAVVHADVIDSAADGFTVKTTVSIHASPSEVYRRLVTNVGDWWNSAHTFSQDAHNLSIEERPMGCFCEKLPNQGFVRHMEVIYVQPGKTLRLSGAIGPLQTMAVSAVATFSLSPEGEGTKLEFTYRVGGYNPGGLIQMAPLVDHVWAEQIGRLKNLIETGNASGKSKP